jgi:hypothetical protein
MGRQINLSHDDRLLLREILDDLGLDQKGLAWQAEVTQSWLSQIFTGRRTNVDGKMLERIANVLIKGLQNYKSDSPFPEGRTRVILEFLNRFTAAADSVGATKLYQPGGPVPVDARYYISRPEDNKLLEAINQMPFTMLVRGPVQCGKSSLLARLEHKARLLGIETAWFDPKLLIIQTPQNVREQPDINVMAAMALSELLQVQWRLEQSPDGRTNSVAKLFNWLSQALASTATKSRLLILDDLSCIGGQAVEEWLSYFVRALHNKRATGGPQLSIAVGLTNHFGSNFSRRLHYLSSIVYWWPSIELSWLTNTQVTKLEDTIVGSALETEDLYRLFAGQPYLTHAAAVDFGFRESVRNWINNSSEINAQPVRGSQSYERHLSAIRRAILGPTLEAEHDSIRLLKAFEGACNGQSPSDYDHNLFLKMAKLSNEFGEPALSIYRLFADDLIESIRR